jgi:hypothetical protein
MLLAELDLSGASKIAGSGRDDQDDLRRLHGAARSGVRARCRAGGRLVSRREQLGGAYEGEQEGPGWR